MKNSQRGFIIPLVIAIVVILIVAGGIYVYKQDKSNMNSVEGWALPTSNKRGFSFIRADEKNNNIPSLFVYNLDDNKLSLVTSNVGDWGAGIGIGETRPYTSPNELYTVYTDDNGSIILLSNQTLQKKKILNNPSGSPTVYSTVSWSPDGKKILFSEIIKDTMGFIPKAHAAEDNSQTLNKYHIFNLEDGTVADFSFYPIDSFIDDDHLLAFAGKKPVVLNIKTYSQDDSEAKKLTLMNLSGLDVNITHYDFSQDGNNVTYDTSTNNWKNSEVLYTDFIEKNTTTIISGSYAQYQQPIISQSGRKIAYQEDLHLQPGEGALYKIWVYNVNLKTRDAYGEGRPIQWIDDNLLIIEISKSDTGYIPDYYLLDLTSGKRIKLNA